MKKRITSLLMAFVACMTVLAVDLPSNGVYRIVNRKYQKAISEIFSSHRLVCTGVKDKGAYDQLWKVTKSGTSYYLENVYTGQYVNAQGSASTQFFTGKSKVNVTLTKTSDGNYLLIRCGGYMHCDAGSNVVNWYDTSNEGDHWSFEAVDGITDDVIAQAREEYANLNQMMDASNVARYNTALAGFFTDMSCAELKGEYASKSDADLVAAMSGAGLPEIFGKMAVKVKNGWWSNTEKSDLADANTYAKTFRVHDFEPYVDANSWQDKLGHHGWSYMNNPTGIYANAKDVLYVFVGNEIPKGATLYLAEVVQNDLIKNRTEGTALKQGLNIVVVPRDSAYYYMLYTVDTSIEKNVKVSDYPNLKIHIEGGDARGYYNKAWKDEAMYAYLSKNAQDKNIFIVKGDRGVFSFSKEAYRKIWPEKIGESINWFDNAITWEEMVQGFQAPVAEGKMSGEPWYVEGGKAIFPYYCNNHHFAFQGPDGSNPNATWYRSSYPGIGGIESSFNVYREDFDNWCVGHEVGHTYQKLINLESCKESSNNFYSDLVTWFSGYRMSRGGSIAESVKEFEKNTVYQLRDIGNTHRFWYQLFMYYHMAGHKKDFFPTLFNLLREDPVVLKNGHNPESGLKIARMVCKAANEDLTEFLDFWGFFIPYENVYFGDYTSYTCTITQEDIDAVKAEIAKYPKKNNQIIFIEDRIKPVKRFDIWADESNPNKTWRPTHWGTKFKKGEMGDVGHYTDYMADSLVLGDYTYSLSGTTVTMEGKGGVGFAVYSKEGKPVTYSNFCTFEVSAKALVNGVVFKVINADGSASEIRNVLEVGSDEQKLNALKEAVETAQKMLTLEDGTGKKVGFYAQDKLETLKALVNKANEAIANAEASAYADLNKQLSEEMLQLQVNGSMNSVKSNGFYRIQNVRNNKMYLYTASNGKLSGNSTASSQNTQWIFVPADQEEVFYLQNRGTGKYINSFKKNAFEALGTSKADAVPFKLNSLGDGKFAIQKTENGQSVNLDPYGSVAEWSVDEGSKWTITLVSEFNGIAMEELSELCDEAETLLNKVASVKRLNKNLKLQVTDNTADNYLSTNQQETKQGPIQNLLDNNAGTFFHSNWSNNKNTTEYHYLQVDLGADTENRLDAVSITYTTRSDDHITKPKTIVVSGSNNNRTFTTVATLSDLPVNQTSQQSYTGQPVQSKTAYRYWRFSVTKTNRNEEDTYPYFSMAKFALFNRSMQVTMNPGFEAVDEDLVKNLVNELSNANSVVSGSQGMSAYDLGKVYDGLNKSYDNLKNAAATGIQDVEGAVSANGRQGIYDLYGRRVQQPVRGQIYIMNGKKVIF